MPNSAGGYGSYEEALRELGRLLRGLRERAGTPPHRQIRERGIELFGASEAISEPLIARTLAGRGRPRSLARLLWLVRTLQSYPLRPGQERQDSLLGPYLDLWSALETLHRPAAHADPNVASSGLGSAFRGPVAGSREWRGERSEGDGLSPGSPGPVIDPDDDWPRRR
jgi:hypothetical protein